MKTLPLALLLLAATVPALAQTVWRCGPDGRSFQAQPCTGGQALALEPAPGAAAVAEARAQAERDRGAVARLAAERRARERDAVAGAAGIAVARPAPPLRTARSAPAGCGTWPAAAPASPRAAGARGCS